MLMPARFPVAPVRRWACSSSPTSDAEKFLLVKSLLSLEHEIGCPTQLVSQNGQGFALAVFTGVNGNVKVYQKRQ
jgi:hypothetical protein